MSTTTNKKSGKGTMDGVTSELTTVFTIKPGHADEMRAACERFNKLMHEPGWRQQAQKSGLREWRQAIVNNGQHLLFMTTFETDWDPYIDDAVLVIGIDHIIDWLRHTVEAEQYRAELQPTVDAARKGIANTVTLKKILQGVQIQASSFWDALSDETVPQIRKAQQLQKSFDKVLDSPEGAKALQQPALKPLLDQASA